MPHRLKFDADILNSVAGGRSAIDIRRLNISSLEAAKSFISCYGFDIDKKESVESLWYFHRRALVLMTEKLGFKESEIPEILRNPKLLKDISRLLIYASSMDPAEKQLQRWSCAILRCMHVFVHAENDLFSSFSHEIQNQILEPFQHSIINDGSQHKTYLRSHQNKNKKNHDYDVELVGFEVKPFKTSSSTVIKLLARPDALAMKIFDKLGVRFITKSLFDSFQVIRFLADESIISFPHIMPDQSSNNLYPVSLFLKICDEMTQSGEGYSEAAVELMFNKTYQEALSSPEFKEQLFRKPNEQSATDFRFIKFITRKLITISPRGQKPFSFFYPYEVQIMDQESHKKASSGPQEHYAYKERQKKIARDRVLPEADL